MYYPSLAIFTATTHLTYVVIMEALPSLQVVIDVAVHSTDGLSRAHVSELLPALLSELNGSDVLLQLNCLELLTKLALCDHGLQYLEEHGVLKSLAVKVATISEDPLASLVLPGKLHYCLKFCTSMHEMTLKPDMHA